MVIRHDFKINNNHKYFLPQKHEQKEEKKNEKKNKIHINVMRNGENILEII